MDLLKGPIREGSRGGRADFKWSDVAADKDRENYLGHSLMAPVGRWQKNKDLSWYSKASSNQTPEQARVAATEARKEELRLIKEAENDALSEALGFPVNRRRVDPGLSQGEVDKAINEAEAEDEEGAEGKGVGFGRSVFGAAQGSGAEREVLGGQVANSNFVPVNKERRRSRSREREKGHRRRDGSRERHRRHRRSRSRERDRDRTTLRERETEKPRERSRDRERRREGDKDRHRTRDDCDRERGDERHRRDRRERMRSRSPRERRR